MNITPKQAIAPAVNPLPAEIARQALADMSLAERIRLMDLHMQGFDSEPLLQDHIENELEEFQQKMAEFSEHSLENMRRIALVSTHMAQQIEEVGFLESIEEQIRTLSVTIRDFEPVERGLSLEVQTVKERIAERNAKMQELTAILNNLKQKLSSSQGRQRATTQAIYAVGENMSRSMVGLPYVPTPSSRGETGGPALFK